MKTTYKMVPITIWNMMEFRAFSLIEKLIYLYLIAGPETRPLGLFRIDLAWIACQFAITQKRLVGIINKFEELGLVMFSAKYSEIYIPEYFVRYATQGGPPLVKVLRSDFTNAQDRQMLQICIRDNRAFLNSRPDYKNITVDEFLNEAQETLDKEIGSKTGKRTGAKEKAVEEPVSAVTAGNEDVKSDEFTRDDFYALYRESLDEDDEEDVYQN